MYDQRKLLIVGTLDETLMIIKGREIQNVLAYIKQEYNYNLLSFFGCARPYVTLLLCIEATADNEKINATFEVKKEEAQEILDNILMQLPRMFRPAVDSDDDTEAEQEADQEKEQDDGQSEEEQDDGQSEQEDDDEEEQDDEEEHADEEAEQTRPLADEPKPKATVVGDSNIPST
jgi:hypothetical protein